MKLGHYKTSQIINGKPMVVLLAKFEPQEIAAMFGIPAPTNARVALTRISDTEHSFKKALPGEHGYQLSISKRGVGTAVFNFPPCAKFQRTLFGSTSVNTAHVTDSNGWPCLRFNTPIAAGKPRAYNRRTITIAETKKRIDRPLTERTAARKKIAPPWEEQPVYARKMPESSNLMLATVGAAVRVLNKGAASGELRLSLDEDGQIGVKFGD